MKKPKMKIKEVAVGLSGVISVAAYENLRPSFLITAEPLEGQSAYDIVVYSPINARGVESQQGRSH
jgi:hypothetical protein